MEGDVEPIPVVIYRQYRRGPLRMVRLLLTTSTESPTGCPTFSFYSSSSGWSRGATSGVQMPTQHLCRTRVQSSREGKMIFFSWPEATILFRNLFFFFVLSATLFSPPLFAAELLPFPSQNRAPQVEQSAPRYRQPQLELEQFRRDIATFPCPELNALYSRIRNQFDAARTTADQEYYSRFLNELYGEISGRCKK